MEARTEGEALTEAVVGHRADELDVDVHEFEQMLLCLAVQHLRKPLLVLAKRFEQDARAGVLWVVLLVQVQLAVVEVGEDAVHLSHLPSYWQEDVAGVLEDAIVIFIGDIIAFVVPVQPRLAPAAL